MNKCNFEIYFDEYIRGELAPDEDIQFIQHLESCKTCPESLNQFYRLHGYLSDRTRPDPPATLLKTYHNNLKTGLLINRPFRFVTIILDKLFYTPSRWVRLVEVVVLLAIGFGIGLIYWNGAKEADNIVFDPPEYFAQPISKVDRDYMKYYFSASEMILLEMMNDDEEIELFLTREVAQKLLVKTFLVHELALKINEPDVLRFLGKMELILIELTNASDEELPERIKAMKEVIVDQRMLDEVRELHKILKNSGSPGNLPG